MLLPELLWKYLDFFLVRILLVLHNNVFTLIISKQLFYLTISVVILLDSSPVWNFKICLHIDIQRYWNFHSFAPQLCLKQSLLQLKASYFLYVDLRTVCYYCPWNINFLKLSLHRHVSDSLFSKPAKLPFVSVKSSLCCVTCLLHKQFNDAQPSHFVLDINCILCSHFKVVELLYLLKYLIFLVTDPCCRS